MDPVTMDDLARTLAIVTVRLERATQERARAEAEAAAATARAAELEAELAGARTLADEATRLLALCRKGDDGERPERPDGGAGQRGEPTGPDHGQPEAELLRPGA